MVAELQAAIDVIELMPMGEITNIVPRIEDTRNVRLPNVYHASPYCLFFDRGLSNGFHMLVILIVKKQKSIISFFLLIFTTHHNKSSFLCFLLEELFMFNDFF
ncbi:hypothetical protein ACJX0J_027776, partial [Zea mays]